MPAVKQPKPAELDFIRQSDTQSACMYYAEIIRVSSAACLKIAEEVHSDFCAAQPQKESRRA